jgi:formate dehydrogenase major subunit
MADGSPKWSLDLDAVDGGGDTTLAAISPFTCTPTGVARLFASGMADGPFPAYYEPLDLDRKNQIAGNFRTNPLLIEEPSPDKSQFPYIGVLFHLPVFSHGGARERAIKNIAELVPVFYIEVGEEFAKEKGFQPGQKVNLTSPHLSGSGIEAVIRITRRLKNVGGRQIIGVPCDFGAAGRIVGGSGAALARSTCDPNVFGAECRFFVCNLS